jgi:hypothetical protein
LKLGLDGQWMMPNEEQKTSRKDGDISIGFRVGGWKTATAVVHLSSEDFASEDASARDQTGQAARAAGPEETPA